MANIRVDVNYTIKDGSEIVFRSPVDCTAITGLIVYYLGEDGNTTSKEFAFADAHGNNVGDIPHLFAENVVVKVILDVTSGMAFVQNADTNAYLERRFAEIMSQMNYVSSDKVIAPEQELTFSEEKGVQMSYNLMLTEPLVIGKTYKVAWGDKEIFCECYDKANGGGLELNAPMLGNASLFLNVMPNTGEPFFISVSTQTGVVKSAEDNNTTIAIYCAEEMASKAYVHAYVAENAGSGGASSWDDLKDKPFYEESTEEVLRDYSAMNGFAPMADYFGLYGIDTRYPGFELVVGDVYIVKWDGNTYECEAHDISAVLPGAIGLGNLSNFIGVGNNEPFAIGWLPTGAVILDMNTVNPQASHEIGVSRKVTELKKLDAKYLPMDAIDARIDAYIEEALGGEF